MAHRLVAAAIAGALLAACGQAPHAGTSHPSAAPPAQGVSVTPAPDAQIAAGAPLVVGASFPARVDPASVRLRVAGRDVTPDAEVLPQSVRYRVALPPGGYEADVQAREVGGAALQRTWRFQVVATPSILPDPAPPRGAGTPDARR